MFLQTPATPNDSGIIYAFPIIAIIYIVLVVLPTRRDRKKVQAMIDSLKVGDKVITSSGIYGTIAGLREDRIQIRVAENVKLEMSRNAVTAFQNPDPEQTK